MRRATNFRCNVGRMSNAWGPRAWVPSSFLPRHSFKDWVMQGSPCCIRALWRSVPAWTAPRHHLFASLPPDARFAMTISGLGPMASAPPRPNG